MAREVPSIIIVEPVYPSPGSHDSVWVECEAVWDADRGDFINRDADEDWVLDEHAHNDSEYIVDGESYTSMDEAMRAALGETAYQRHDPTVRLEFDG